jgi:hypothetical protein
MANSFALSTGFAAASNAGVGFSLPPDVAQTPAPARTTTMTPAPIQSGLFEGSTKEADDSASSAGARPLAGGPMGVCVDSGALAGGCG